MAQYNLVLIGESDFTGFFAETFKNHLSLFVVKNSNFKKGFSAQCFPSKSFIPDGTETASAYGQVCSDFFRIDLIHNLNLLTLFFDRDLRCNKDLLDSFVIKSAEYFEVLNNIIIENYPKGLTGLFFKRPLYFLKNYKLLANLIKNNPCPTEEFKIFMSGLSSFFAPGEKNYNYYKFYLLFSLLNKEVYKITDKTDSLKNIDSMDNDTLSEISYEKTRWKVVFHKDVIYADFIVSAVTPHIFSFNAVKTPFRTDYDHIFYEFFIDEIELPEPMLEELVFVDKKGREYLAVKRNNTLTIYSPGNIDVVPQVNLIEPFVEQFVPYLDLDKNILVRPTVTPYHKKEKFRRFRDKRSFYFPKSYDFPYYGVDGEILYRNKLRDIIWKKFLS
ncbi:MAG: hypothetical protein N2999_01980 [Proteobacteria bacterium]|nr:hypothetical protein [Pseudomonadota bacterium]